MQRESTLKIQISPWGTWNLVFNAVDSELKNEAYLEATTWFELPGG